MKWITLRIYPSPMYGPCANVHSRSVDANCYRTRPERDSSR